MESPDLELFENVELKMAAVDALDELMKQTSLDRLSVSKICETAGISRATFYRHFKDKFSIVQWFIKFIHSQSTNEIGRTLSWYEGYYTSELTIANRRSFFSNAAKSKDYNSLDMFIPRYRREVLTTTLTDYHGIKIDEHLRFLVRATVEMEIHMLPTWHYGKLDCTLEEACRWLTECIPRELFEMLDTPVKPQAELPLRTRNGRIGSGAVFNPSGYRHTKFTNANPPQR